MITRIKVLISLLVLLPTMIVIHLKSAFGRVKFIDTILLAAHIYLQVFTHPIQAIRPLEHSNDLVIEAALTFNFRIKSILTLIYSKVNKPWPYGVITAGSSQELKGRGDSSQSGHYT